MVTTRSGRHVGITGPTSTASGEQSISDVALPQIPILMEDQLRGDLLQDDSRIKVIRDLSEIHGATWRKADGTTQPVAFKTLRYFTIMENDIHLSKEYIQVEKRRILREIRVWCSLSHPNIMPLLGYQWPKAPNLVFQWYENGNISQYLKTHPKADRLTLLDDVAMGLAYLHSRTPDPIIHGGIKPSNVIISNSTRAMLCDFGIAADLRKVERTVTIADPGRAVVGYMSPELIQEGEHSKQSDVYAFGALVLETLTGRPPFANFNYVHAMMKIHAGEQPSPDDYPEIPATEATWAVMRQCWNSDPTNRPKIQEARQQLKKATRKSILSWVPFSGLVGNVWCYVTSSMWPHH